MASFLDGLESKGLVNQSRIGRVPKFEERLSARHQLVPCEMAALCVMMLRGPQTAGEIRSRSGRMCVFESLEAVGETLEKLADWHEFLSVLAAGGPKPAAIGTHAPNDIPVQHRFL